MEFVGKYQNWYDRLVEAGYEDAENKVKNFMDAHNDIIWEKTVNSGQLNVKRMPLRSHENILIFYNKNRYLLEPFYHD